MRDDLGEPVVVAGKALGMPRDVLYRILMFVNPAVGHSVERVHALAALYDEMTPPRPRAWSRSGRRCNRTNAPAAKHQPITWDDEAATGAPARQCNAPLPRRTGGRRSARKRRASAFNRERNAAVERV